MQIKNFEFYNQDNLIVEEAFSFLKTNYNFSNIDKKYNSLVLLSCNPYEGKTTIAINLAINFAKGGKKVLLVDTDLRKPIKAKRISGELEKGLSNYFSDKLGLQDIIMNTNIDNFFYLPSGPKIMNPAELLDSEAYIDFMGKLKSEFEMVIFDTPAMNSVIDGYILASKADSTALVVKAGAVKLTQIKRVKEQLEKAKANVIGVILNKVEQKEYRKIFDSYDYFTKGEKFDKLMKRPKF